MVQIKHIGPYFKNNNSGELKVAGAQHLVQVGKRKQILTCPYLAVHRYINLNCLQDFNGERLIPRQEAELFHATFESIM